MRKKRDVDLLKARLDVYSDEWRTAQPDPITKVKMPTNLTPTGKVRKPRLKKNNVSAVNAQNNTDADLKPLIDGKLSKRKRSKLDKVSFIEVLVENCVLAPFFYMTGYTFFTIDLTHCFFIVYTARERSKCTKTAGQSIFPILPRTTLHSNGRIE